MSTFKSCRACTKRCPGCHSKCKEYQDEKAEHERLMNAQKGERDVVGYRCNMHCKRPHK